jgi:hypothetical protein
LPRNIERKLMETVVYHCYRLYNAENGTLVGWIRLSEKEFFPSPQAKTFGPFLMKHFEKYSPALEGKPDWNAYVNLEKWEKST